MGIKRKKDLDNVDSLSFSDFGGSEYPYDHGHEHEHGHEHDYHHFDDRHIESLSGNIEENHPGLNFEPERRRRQRSRRRLLDLEGEELAGSGGFYCISINDLCINKI